MRDRLDILNASKYLGLSYQKTRKLIDNGHIKATNFGTGTTRQMKMVKISELDRFLEEGVNAS